MGTTKDEGIKTRRRRKATTVEGRENQLTALAMDAVEARIRNGTATAQELVYFMKLGSSESKRKARMEEEQIKLMIAKTESLQAQRYSEELVNDALTAFKRYSGHREDYEDEEDI